MAQLTTEWVLSSVTTSLQSHELTAARLSLHAGIAQPHLLWHEGIPLGPCHATAYNVRHHNHQQHCFLLQTSTQPTLGCTDAYAMSDNAKKGPLKCNS